MSGLFKSKAPKFVEPKAVEAPAPAVDVAAAPVTEVDSGTGTADAAEELRKKYRPTKGIGTTGTGLSV